MSSFLYDAMKPAIRLTIGITCIAIPIISFLIFMFWEAGWVGITIIAATFAGVALLAFGLNILSGNHG